MHSLPINLPEEEISKRLWLLFYRVGLAFSEKRRGGVKPEEVFPDMPLAQWAEVLCLWLIRRSKHIKSQLEKKGRYNAFATAIGEWEDKYVNAPSNNYSYEEAARALFEICSQFGLIDALLDEESLARACVSPRALHTKGVFMVDVKNLKQRMEEVAKAFGHG